MAEATARRGSPLLSGSQPLRWRSHIQSPRGRGGSHRPAPLWRPWLSTPPEDTKEDQQHTSPAQDRGGCRTSKALSAFRHPVRLCWHKSRSFDYLYAEGEKLLENFPVQATIHFFDSSEESGSDSQEDEEEDQDPGVASLPQATDPDSRMLQP